MLKGYRCAVYTTRIYAVKPKKPGLPSVVSAAPQPGGTFTQLQGGGDRTRGWYRHHDLGVSLHLDTMRLSQAWRCANAVACWTAHKVRAVCTLPASFNRQGAGRRPPTAHTREGNECREGAGGTGGWAMS